MTERRMIKHRFTTQDEFERTLDSAETNAATEFEMDFVGSIKEKYQLFGMKGYLSERQEETLDRIAWKNRET